MRKTERFSVPQMDATVKMICICRFFLLRCPLIFSLFPQSAHTRKPESGCTNPVFVLLPCAMCFCLSCALSHSSCEIIGSWLLCTTIQSFLSLAQRLWFLYEIVVSCNCAKCPKYIMLFTIYVDIEKAAHFVRLFLVGVARFVANASLV